MDKIIASINSSSNLTPQEVISLRERQINNLTQDKKILRDEIEMLKNKIEVISQERNVDLDHNHIQIVHSYEDKISEKLQEIDQLKATLQYERQHKLEKAGVEPLHQEIEHLKVLNSAHQNELKMNKNMISSYKVRESNRIADKNNE